MTEPGHGADAEKGSAAERLAPAELLRGLRVGGGRQTSPATSPQTDRVVVRRRRWSLLAATLIAAASVYWSTLVRNDFRANSLPVVTVSGSVSNQGVPAMRRANRQRFVESFLASAFIATCGPVIAGDVLMWGPNAATDCANGQWDGGWCAELGPVPTLPGDAVAVSASGPTTAALLANGRVICWGPAGSGATTVPDGMPPIRELAVGGLGSIAHVVAVDTSGTLHAWGRNDEGQCAVPAELGAVAHVGAGGNHTIVVQADGVVRCWGSNNFGQCSVPSDLPPVHAVSGGWRSTAVLCTDGTVRCWGDNSFGQCDVPAGLTGVVGIDSGDVHVVVVKADGTVRCWGSNDVGRCDVPAGLTDVVRASAGWGHTVALRRDGSVVQWGNDMYRQFKNLPTGPVGIVAVDAGYFHTVAITMPCIGDVVRDGVVDGADLSALLAYWGPSSSAEPSQRCDLDGSGTVDGADLSLLLADWGPCGN